MYDKNNMLLYCCSHELLLIQQEWVAGVVGVHIVVVGDDGVDDNDAS